MKTKGRRQSKNIEVQTEKQRKAAIHGRKLQDKVEDNKSFLFDDTPISRWGDAREDWVKRVNNPGNTQSKFPSTQSSAEKRKIKDPKPQNFEFFKHHTTEK